MSIIGTEVQFALGVLQQAQLAQNIFGASGGANASASPLTVLQAVEAVPGVIAPADAARIRELITAGNSGEALQKLAAFHDVLQVVRQECVAGVPAAATLPLERIAELFGLVTHDFRPSPGGPQERMRSYSPAAPLAPDVAPRIALEFGVGASHPHTMKPVADGAIPLSLRLGREGASDAVFPDMSVSGKHAEIEFVNGHYWVQDSGSLNGTYVNGTRLSAHERRSLKDGDRIGIGRYTMTVRLPYELRLRHLAESLKEAASYNEIYEVLDAAGFGHVAPKIKEILTRRVPVSERLDSLRAEIPYDGGLLLKLEAVLLRGEVVRLRSLFFPSKTPQQALEAGTRLAASLAQARSFADLADRLIRTNGEAFGEWVARIEKLQRFAMGYRAEEDIRLNDFPDIFGLKAQVHRIFMEGLSLDADQRRDLQWRGVTPDILLERPWRRIDVPPLLAEALEPFRGVIGQRLNLDDMEKTITGSFADETDSPSVSDVENKAVGTVAILYQKYQNEKPTSSLGGAVTESQKPGFFMRVLERLAKDGVPVSPDGYWFFGGTFAFQERVEGRIYLSLKRRHAEAIFRYLSGVIEPAIHKEKGQIQFKIAGNAEGYSRSDSGVIYFHAKNQELIYKLVREMSRAHPEFFKEGHPHFTFALRDEKGAVLPGLSFGEHPKHSGQSFGSKRTDAMTTAVRTARALMATAEPPDWKEIRQICAYFLKRAGIDIDHPAFEEGGAQKFGPLLKRCETPAVVPASNMAPAAQAEPAVDPARTTSMIKTEILQRYPRLRTRAGTELAEAVAQRLYQRWEKSGRFPGAASNAPSYLPEDIFEQGIADLRSSLEKRDPSNPLWREFLDAIVNGDQGPRTLRALTERLAGRCPVLRDPKNEKLLRSIAEGIHTTWKKGEPTAEALETIFRRQIAFLISHIEKTDDRHPFSLRLKAELEDLLAAR